MRFENLMENVVQKGQNSVRFCFTVWGMACMFISSTISFLFFSGRLHKMTHKGWRVVKPQHNQSKSGFTLFAQSYLSESFVQIRYIICSGLSVRKLGRNIRQVYKSCDNNKSKLPIISDTSITVFNIKENVYSAMIFMLIESSFVKYVCS